jgi:hypothetical protein
MNSDFDIWMLKSGRYEIVNWANCEQSTVPVRRRRATAKRYPFETMEAGQSFLIPKSEDNPHPRRRIASVVHLSTKYLAPKQFTIKTVIETNPDGSKRKGARVFGIA